MIFHFIVLQWRFLRKGANESGGCMSDYFNLLYFLFYINFYSVHFHKF